MFQKEGDLVRKTWRKNRVPRRGEGGEVIYDPPL